MLPGEVKTKLMDDTTEGVVLDAGKGSPNRLLYVPAEKWYLLEQPVSQSKNHSLFHNIIFGGLITTFLGSISVFAQESGGMLEIPF